MEMHQRCAMVMVARDEIEPRRPVQGLLPMELTNGIRPPVTNC